MYYRRYYRGSWYKSQNTNNTTTIKIEDTDGSLKLTKRLAKLLAEPSLTDGHKTFVSSVNDFYTRKSYLSTKQFEYFEKIESQYSSTAKKSKNSWLKSYSDEKKRNFKICVFYYKANGSYFSSTVEKVKNDPNYIPTFEEYNKICDNKFSIRVLAGVTATPKFDADTMVTLDDKWFKASIQSRTILTKLGKSVPPDVQHIYRVNPTTKAYESIKLEKSIYTVVSCDDITPISACKGNKIYTLLLVHGDTADKSLVYCEERYLRKVK